MPASGHEQHESFSTFRATDGASLRYRVWPCPDGEPEATLVLLNGIMSNSSWFAPLIPHLRHLHVVGADRRGSGPNLSARGDAPGAGQLVDDVLAIVDAEHASSRPLVLLGWCWGAALAVAAAHQLRDKVAGLVAVTPGLFPTAALEQAIVSQAARIDGAAPDEAVVQSPIREEMFTAGPALEGFIRRDEHRVQRMTPRMLQVSRKLAAAAVARLGRLQPPVLLVLADDDDATDNAPTRRAFDRLGADRLEVVELQAKHGVQFDAPEDLCRHLSAFVQRVGRSRAHP
jgi:alpha-beta hydrolase superfamily lysophospholipase